MPGWGCRQRATPTLEECVEWLQLLVTADAKTSRQLHDCRTAASRIQVECHRWPLLRCNNVAHVLEFGQRIHISQHQLTRTQRCCSARPRDIVRQSPLRTQDTSPPSKVGRTVIKPNIQLHASSCMRARIFSSLSVLKYMY